MASMKIQIKANVLHEMQQYAYYAQKHFNSEIAGWGHYSKKNGIYKLAPLTKQIVSGAEVDNFPNEILNDIKYDISDMIVQWHSHVNMSCSPSKTDIDNIKDTLRIVPTLISIIVNCKGEYTARLDYNSIGSKAINIKVEQQTIDVVLVPYYSDNKVEREVLKKCRRPKPIQIEKEVIIPSVKNHINSDVPTLFQENQSDFIQDYHPPVSRYLISETMFTKAVEIILKIAEMNKDFEIISDLSNPSSAKYLIAVDYRSGTSFFISKDLCNVNGIDEGSIYKNIEAFIEKTGVVNFTKEEIKLW